jgi:hypothetical protein
MSSRGRKIWISLPVILVTAALAPSAAGANPLLSGYGGPGQGDQAILGATLLNTPGSGGGSSGSSSSASAADSSAALTVPSGATQSHAKPAGHAPRRHGTAHSVARSQTKATSPTSLPGGGPVRDVAATGSTGGGTLGLSGGDFLYLLLALAALALTGVLTRQLARRPH